jgi:predicted RNase H-like nuclease (RuvC/YqgF family)
MEVNMLRKVSTLSFAGALIAGVLVSTPAYAAISNGSTCTVVNRTVKVGTFTYKCLTAVRSTITIESTKATVYVISPAKTKNAKKYYLSSDCINETAYYAKSLAGLATLEKNTAAALLEVDAQIADQVKAIAASQIQIEALTKENADIALKIKEQTDLIPVAEKEVADLTIKIAAVTKQIDEFTIILNDSRTKLATLKADTVNAAKNATTISKLSSAISQLSSSITSLKSSNSLTKMQMQSVSSSISKYNSSIMQLKSTTNKNLTSIENTKKLSSTIETLNKTKELTSSQVKQAKDVLVQTKNSRNLLCSAGL